MMDCTHRVQGVCSASVMGEEGETSVGHHETLAGKSVVKYVTLRTSVSHYADKCVTLCRQACHTMPTCVSHYDDKCVTLCRQACHTMRTSVSHYAD